MQTQNSNPISRYAVSPGRLVRAWGVAFLAVIVILSAFTFPLPARAAPQGSFACTYVVRPGDDLFRIGLLYNVSWWDLAIANGLPNPHLIFAGMILRVPCPPGPPVTPPPSPSICDNYIVKRGEWLSMIGDRYGVSWQELAAVNRLANPNLIYPGQRLLIPCATHGQGPVTPTPDPALTDEFNQVVSTLVTGGDVSRLNNRLQVAGMLPYGRSVLDYVNRNKIAGWKGPGQCLAGQGKPYEIMADPVNPGLGLTGQYGTFLGILVLPACSVSEVLRQGFGLRTTEGPVIYALASKDQTLADLLGGALRPSTKQGLLPFATQGQTPTPIPGPPLDLYASVSDLDLRGIAGTQIQTYPSVPEPIITLGSICFQVDGIRYCWWQ